MQDSSIETQETEQTAKNFISETEEIENLLGGGQDAAEEQSESEAIEALLDGENVEQGANLEAENEEAEPEQAELEESEQKAEDSEKSGIDYDQKIPMPNGESVSIGELKDAWQQQTDKTLEFIERENALKSEMSLLHSVAESLEGLPAEQKQQLIESRKAEVDRENKLVMQVIPEWSNPETLKADYQNIMDLAASYGAVDSVKAVFDHKLVNILNDYAKIRASIKKSRIRPKKTLKPAGKPAKPVSKKPVGGSELDRINHILSEG